MRRGEGAGETEDGGERKPDACAMGTDSNRVEQLAILTMIQFEVKSGLFGLYLALYGFTRGTWLEVAVNSH